MLGQLELSMRAESRKKEMRITMSTISVHGLHLEFENHKIKEPSCRTTERKSHFVSDEEGHYDICGVSFSSQGVIVASDGAILTEVTGEYLFFIQRLWRYS